MNHLRETFENYIENRTLKSNSALLTGEKHASSTTNLKNKKSICSGLLDSKTLRIYSIKKCIELTKLVTHVFR